MYALKKHLYLVLRRILRQEHRRICGVHTTSLNKRSCYAGFPRQRRNHPLNKWAVPGQQLHAAALHLKVPSLHISRHRIPVGIHDQLYQFGEQRIIQALFGERTKDAEPVQGEDVRA